MASCKSNESVVRKRPPPSKPNPKPEEEDSSNTAENDGKNCCICCEETKVFAIGACDHPICYRCSARMRVLSKQTYCATCRAEMKQVVLSFQDKKFGEFGLKNMKKCNGGFYFEEWRLADIFNELFHNVCVECPSLDKPFNSFEELRGHLRKSHEKQFCQICIDSLSNFPRELKMYTRKELVTHRKEGDAEDKSHRGHPECKFCSDRFLDNDTLLLHLRKGHFWCHFCEHDGKQEYYNVYKDLRCHFGEVHFLCDEGECQYEKFTSVFRNKIDYQAHKLAAHGKNFDKVQAKEARKIEVEFKDYRYNKRQPPTVADHVTGADYAEVQNSPKQRRGEMSSARKGNQNTMDFSHFEDVERERQELKREKDRERDKFKGVENKGGSRRDQHVVSSASSYSGGQDGGYQDGDDDVIGITEHINRREDTSNRRKDDGVAKPPPKENLSNNEKNPPQQKLEKQIINKPEGRSSPRVLEDFPSLPGGVPSPDINTSRKKPEEDFPALGKSIAPKEPPITFNTKSDSQPQHINGIPVTVKKKKEKGKSWTQQSGRGNLTSTDDFPTLQSIDLNQNMKEDKPRVKSPNVTSKASARPPPPGYSKNMPPPPGYSKNMPPPPGYSKNMSPPPGYSKNMNGESPPSINQSQNNSFTSKGKGPPGFGAGKVRKKDEMPPPGFQNSQSDTTENKLRERNIRLVGLLQTHLDDFNLQVFKNISGDFRRGTTSAVEYYSGIAELLGDNLKYVFSELVALLPDEKKQQELLQLHQNAKLLSKQKVESIVISNAPKRAVWGSNSIVETKSVAKDDETWCADCGKTFPRGQMVKHMESHGEAFPSLPTSQKKKYMPLTTVHQSQRRNPWSK